MADRPYTDAELEAEHVHEIAAKAGCWPHQVRAVLSAVLPDHDARVRARVAEEIEAIVIGTDEFLMGVQHAADVARAHATPPTTEEPT